MYVATISGKTYETTLNPSIIVLQEKAVHRIITFSHEYSDHIVQAMGIAALQACFLHVNPYCM